MSGSSALSTKQRLQALVADKRYWDFNHPEREAYVAYVTGEFRRAYPGKADHANMNSKLPSNDDEGGGGMVHVQSHTRSISGHQVAVNDYYRSPPGSGGGHRMPKHMKPTNEPIRPSDYYRDLGFDPNGPDLKDIALQNTHAAWKARSIGLEVRDIAREMYGNDRYSLEQGEGDALRHGLWNYRMTKELGADKAKEYSDAYEISNPNNDGDRMKDIFNNAVGRELALDPANHQKPDAEVIKQAIKQGKFQIDPFNAPGPIQPMWGR